MKFKAARQHNLRQGDLIKLHPTCAFGRDQRSVIAKLSLVVSRFEVGSAIVKHRFGQIYIGP